MRKALVRRGGQVIEVDVDDNYVNQLRKAKKGLQVSKSASDPCPPDYYWDEDEGKCVPMSATLPKREELFTNPEMIKDLQRLNDKRRIIDYKQYYRKTRDDFWNENFKGPYIIDDKGRQVPDQNSPEFINYKKLVEERFKDMPDPYKKSFKLPDDFKKKDFYPKDGEWDEDSKKEFNQFFNPEPTEQEKEEGILKEYLKSKPQVNPDFYYKDIPANDPVQQYKMNQDQLRDYRYEEEWCPCYKMKEELIAGRMVTKKVCVPCEQAKMGGSLAKFMQVGGEGSSYPLNNRGEEIRYRKEFDRNGKRIIKETSGYPADLEEGDPRTTKRTKIVLNDDGSGRFVTRKSGFFNYFDPIRGYYQGPPRYSETLPSGSEFNSQPTYQMGGTPQGQMAQMPPQQGQGFEQDQVMQLIQAYAQAMGISAEEIIQQLQQMDPQAQQQAIQQMAQELQGGQPQQQAPQQEMPPEQMMQRGGNSKGADTLEMSTPEYKNDYFAKLTQKFGQNNYDKAFMKDMNSEFQKFQAGGYIQNADGTQSYDLGSGFDPNKLSKANMFQDYANQKKEDGNTFGAFTNLLYTGAEKVGKAANTAAQVAMTAAGVPPGVTNSLTKPKGKDGSGGFDPSQLISMFAKYGGNLPKYQTDGQFTSGIGTFGNSPAWNFGNSGLDNFMNEFEIKNPNYGNQVQPAPVSNIKMADQSKNKPSGLDFGPQDDPITTNATNPNKDKELIAGPDSVKKPNFSLSEMGAGKGMGPAVAGLFEAMGNKGKAKQAEAFAQNAFISDNLFTSNTGDRIDRGDYVMNTQPNNANFRPDQNIPMGPFASEFGKYGMQVAKVGVQVQNPYMSNPYSHPEAILYGEPDPKVSNTLKPVKRENANLEAEVGEVAVTPSGPDGVPKFFKIGGKNHYDGGTPLNLPENTFIFSKTRSMIIKDPKILKELTGSTKPATPADLAKKFDYSEYVATIQNKNSDPVERKTAEFMIENMMYKLGQIAIIQEAKKGFPNGIPLVAVPYLEKAGIAPESILPQIQQEQPPMDPGMQQQMMQQPQEQMDPRMMQEQMQPMPEEMMMPPMARYGGTNLERYQTKGQVLTPEQVAAADQALGRIEHYKIRGQGNADAMAGYKAQIDSLYRNPMYDIKAKVDSLDNIYPTVVSKFTDVPWNQVFDPNKTYNKNLIYRKENISDASIDYLKKNSPEELEKFENRPNPYFKSYNYKKVGGTNIMGGPVIPAYQTGNQVKGNFAQKVLSGKNPITNQEAIPTKKNNSYMPEAWTLYAKAIRSRNLDEINAAADYFEKIDVPNSLGTSFLKPFILQTEQDVFDNAAAALRDRSKMLIKDSEQATMSARQFEENKKLSDFRNKLIELKKSIPYNLENISKIEKINEAIKETAKFSPSKNSNNWFLLPQFDIFDNNYDSPNSLINKYSNLFTEDPSSKTSKEPAKSKTTMAADSASKSTPTAVQAPVKKEKSKSTTNASSNKQPRIKKVESLDGYEILD